MHQSDLIIVPEINPGFDHNVFAFPGQGANAANNQPSQRSPWQYADVKVAAHYQQQFDLLTGQPRGMEALLRATTQAGDAINTADVIVSAEENGHIGMLGRQMLTLACSEFASLKARGLPVGRLAVNVSPLELQSPTYAAGVAHTIKRSGLEYSDIELELTESWSLSDDTLYLNQLNQLTEMGVGLAIDDFGTGYTVWSHVLQIPVTLLKIDRSLIAKMMNCPRAKIIVESICHACNELDLEVLAEGVCTEAQQHALLNMGCSLGQGFGLAMPMPAAELKQQA